MSEKITVDGVEYDYGFKTKYGKTELRVWKGEEIIYEKKENHMFGVTPKLVEDLVREKLNPRELTDEEKEVMKVIEDMKNS